MPDSPRLQASGAERLSMLAATDAGLRAQVEMGAGGKLVGLLQPSTQASALRPVLGAIQSVTRLDEGREALVRAGAVEALEEGLEQGWLQNKGLDEEARLLKVALLVRRDHVD
eukprot:jgi/Botrbrau1/1448/Bobra.178_3s0006.1